MDLKTAERIARGENLIAEAERLLAKHRADKKAARARRRSRSPRASGPTKADRKAAKREETAALRAELFALVGPNCERCAVFILDGCGHMHHTRGGSGRRLAEQSIENVAYLCGDCHRALHREPHLAREFRERLATIRAFPRCPTAARPGCQYGATVCTHAQCRRTP